MRRHFLTGASDCKYSSSECKTLLHWSEIHFQEIYKRKISSGSKILPHPHNFFMVYGIKNMAFNPAEFKVIVRSRNPKYLCYDNSFIMETCV